MSHVCKYVEGECDDCIREAHDYWASDVRAMRGRWLVVYEGGGAIRHRRLSRARREARFAAHIGIPTRVIRYRRDRAIFDQHAIQLVVTDARWLP